MSFFNTSYKPHIRQEGFNPPNLDNTDSNSPLPSPNNHGFPDMFALPQNYNMGDSQQTTTGTRNKYTPSMDFGEDLASLMEDRQGSSSTSSQYDDHHRYGAGTTHNIFDVSAVPIPHPSSVSSTTTGGLGSQPSSLHSDYPHHPPVFNSTLPALNSSMRYEPLPTPSHQQGSPNMSNPPPSAYHTFSVGGSRHTPSPIMNSHHNDARSRSRSRPPTSGAGAGPSSLSNADSKSPTLANAQNASSIGPARTTRTRRNNSVSGTSPPPYGSMHSRPHAIVIPGSARAQQQQQQGWFVSSQSSASEYSLPTPGDSHPISHLNGTSGTGNGNSYNSFSLSPPSESHIGSAGMHLPPVSSLHSPIHTGSYHGHSHSLSMGHRDFGMNSMHGHSQSMSIPKSPGHGPVLDYVLPPYNPNGSNATGNVNGGNSLSYGMTPPGVSVMNLNLNGGVGSPVLSSSVGGAGAGSVRGGGPLSSSVQSSAGTAVNGASAGANSSSTTTGAAGASAHGTVDKQSQLANEKRRRRRESHNAVERRRRDNINEKISELATLIPECMLDGTTANGNGNNGGSPSAMAASPGLLDPSDPLLPSATAAEKKEAAIKEENGEEGTVVKANKGMILRKSVEYIRYLQQLVTAQGARNRELEQELKSYRGGSSGAPSEIGGDKNGATDTDSPLDKDHHQQQQQYGMDQNHHYNHHVQDDDMMLHDSVNEYGNLHVGGMLPSMPEGGEDEGAQERESRKEMEEEEGGMDVDVASGAGGEDEKRERGRTRGVARRGAGYQHGGHGAPSLKEEQEEMTGFASLTMVGMQA